MVKMAEPYKHPKTGVYYLRRQIPDAILLEFGGKLLWKRSLETKDPAAARHLFAIANADLETRFAEARAAVDKRMERDLLFPSAAARMVDRAAKAEGGRFPIITNLYWSEERAREMVGGEPPMFIQDTPEQIEGLRGCPWLPGELFLKVVGTRPGPDAIRMAWFAIERVRGMMQPNHDAYPDVSRTEAMMACC